ncbi:hypothetical protein Trydic_g14108 [Trypoxylus dichotomus]
MTKTWKCVNEVLGRSPSIQGKNIFERHMETTMKEIAEKFCETFASAVSPGDHICQEQLYYNYMKRSGLRCQHIQKESIYIPDITEQELRSMIATMDKEKSPGYDNIMLADVTGTCDSISPALVRLINLSLRNAVIPSLLKVAVVTPIYKNGKKDAYTNYRPISVLSCIDKIIEKYVAKVMHDYLQKYQILNESQYGYRKNRGTIDLLERVADIVNGKLNEHKHVLCLFIDFSKAFDRINHDKLLKILEDLGIRGPLLDWFRCFLANRRFCVKVGNEVSSLRELRAGVPQGSILGPLLYLLYVNDVQHCFQDCKCFLYADDTLILAVHKDIKKAEQMLLREFHRFQLCAHQKDLLINTSKTKLMHIASPHSGVDCYLKLTVHDTDCLHMEDTNHNRNCECDNIIELVHRQKALITTSTYTESSLLVEDNDPYVTNFCRQKCGFKLNICCIYPTTDFGSDCGDGGVLVPIETADIKEILKAHNTLRNEVAAGTSSRGDLRGIQAANMHVLSYSKELAYSARCWAMQCRLGHSRCKAIGAGMAGETICWDAALITGNQSEDRFYKMLTKCPRIHFTNFPLLTTKTIDNLTYPRGGDDERNRETLQVLWAKTQYIGCSRVSFPHLDPLRNVLLLICHFFPMGNILWKPVFIRGPPASRCTDNETRNDVYRHLCGDIRPLNEDYWLSAVSIANCNVYRYHAIASTSNFCKHKCGLKLHICCIYGVEYGSSCLGRPIVQEIANWEKDVILDTHNYLRNLVAGGKAPREDLRGLSASNMHVLSYSKQLAYTASCWAKQCTTGHSRCRSIEEGNVGETVCWAKGYNRKLMNFSSRLIGKCPFFFIRNFPHYSTKVIDSLELPVGSDDERNRESVQLIWARTQYVGCARIAFPHEERGYSTVLVVCHYFPTGNAKGQAIFKRGKPCSECGEYSCNPEYPHLCGRIWSYHEDKWIPPLVRSCVSGQEILTRLYRMIAAILHMHGKLTTLLQRELQLKLFPVYIPF